MEFTCITTHNTFKEIDSDEPVGSICFVEGGIRIVQLSNTKLSYRQLTYDRFMKERILPTSKH